MLSGIKRVISSRVLKIFISAGLLLIIIRFFGFERIVSNIGTSDKKFFLAAVLTFMFSGVAGAVQWGILLKFNGIDLGKASTVVRYFTGLFFNFVLPGFVGGDVMRIYQTSKISGKTTQAVSSTLADRVIGLLILVMFSLCAYVYLPGGPAGEALPVALMMFLVLFLLAVVIAYKPAGKLVKSIMGKFTPETALEKIRLIYKEMHLLTRSPSTLIWVALTSVVIQFTRICVHYLCGRAIGIHAGFEYYLLFVPLMEVIASIPISVGGIGVRETIGATLFMTIGVKSPDVVSYTLLATLAGFAGSLPGGAAFVLSSVKKKHDAGKGRKKHN